VARSSVVGLLREAARLDRTQSDPVVSARNAIGVAAPLAIGALAGNVSFGLPSTIGALQAAFADRPGPYQLRMLRMFATSLAASVTSGLAIAASGSDAASVLLLLGLAFVAGLLLAGGPSATQVGVAGVAAALIIGHTPEPGSVAIHVALLVLAGGVGQTVLAIAAWPLRRHRPERQALAKLYRELAEAARTQVGTAAGPPVGDTLTAVRQTLYGLGADHGPSTEAYRVLLDEAERLRRETVVLIGFAERLAAAKDTRSAADVRTALRAASEVLAGVADALDTGRLMSPDAFDPALAAVQTADDRLSAGADDTVEFSRRAAVGRLGALAGQLRAVIATATTGATEGRSGTDAPNRARTELLRDPVAVLRANLTWRSAVFRHAVRLCVLVAASDFAVRLAGFDRGYWLPLTVLVVLRPDFATTFQRSVMRVLGTVMGLLAVTALVHWVPGGAWWQVALVAALAFGMRFSGPGNLGLTAACLAGLVVVLLEIRGVPAHTTVESRTWATLGGGVLAVLAAVALPAWERRFVPLRLAALLDAYARYTAQVADLHSSRTALQRARAACRLARSNAQASIDRARSEPVRGAAEVELGRAVLAHTHRFIHAMLAVDAIRVPVREGGGVAEWAPFLGAVETALDAARTAILANIRPDAAGRLRAGHGQFAAAVRARPDEVGGIESATALLDATDRITNSIDTLLDELRRQLPLDRPARRASGGQRAGR
jgi:uncharacterized membrane protein YccC